MDDAEQAALNSRRISKPEFAVLKADLNRIRSSPGEDAALEQARGQWRRSATRTFEKEDTAATGNLKRLSVILNRLTIGKSTMEAAELETAAFIAEQEAEFAAEQEAAANPPAIDPMQIRKSELTEQVQNETAASAPEEAAASNAVGDASRLPSMSTKKVRLPGGFQSHSPEVVAAVVCYLYDHPLDPAFTFDPGTVHDEMTRTYPHLMISKRAVKGITDAWSLNMASRPAQILECMGLQSMGQLAEFSSSIATPQRDSADQEGQDGCIVVDSTSTMRREGRLAGRQTMTWVRCQVLQC